MKRLAIDGTGLDLDTVYSVAHDPSRRVALAAGARARCDRNRKVVVRLLREGRPLYGINTGFGDLARVAIAPKDLERLQVNLVRSHACGVGAPLPAPVVRAAVLLRANTLAKGASGVRSELVDALVALLNEDVVPVVPEKGSLGASGDLAPLAHLSLVLLGEGEAWFRGRRMSGGDALEKAGLRPVRLEAKEGLALINGTPVMCALAVEGLHRARTQFRAASTVAAMSIEALQGTDRAFDARLHAARPHPGQVEVARHLRATLCASPIRSSHRECSRVQDAYSLRCTPQVLGAAFDAWAHARNVIEIELNAATDNPLVLGEDVVSGGNFHGEPVGLVMDYLAMAVAEVANIAERRTFRLLTATLSDLPPFLTRNGGVDSGLMIAQYTAASLVSENKILCHPATVDSIPSSADQEDHVSMATTAARKLLLIEDNAASVLGIEYLCAAQALDLLAPLRPGKATGAALRLLRRSVPVLEEDRVLAPDVARARELIESGEVDRVATGAGRFRWAAPWGGGRA